MDRVGVSRRASRDAGIGATQLSLPGFAPVPTPTLEKTDRLFFAVLPDTDAAAHIGRLVQHLSGEHGLRGKLIGEGRLHVSLHGLGDHPGVPEALVAAASQAASTVVLPSFLVRFDRVLSFSGSQALVLTGGDGVPGLQDLRWALALAMQRFGFPRVTTSSFTPHITLLYDTRTISERAIEPVGWMVREFVLVHSRIGQGLPYTLLGRWPLQN